MVESSVAERADGFYRYRLAGFEKLAGRGGEGPARTQRARILSLSTDEQHASSKEDWFLGSNPSIPTKRARNTHGKQAGFPVGQARLGTGVPERSFDGVGVALLLPRPGRHHVCGSRGSELWSPCGGENRRVPRSRA